MHLADAFFQSDVQRRETLPLGPTGPTGPADPGAPGSPEEPDNKKNQPIPVRISRTCVYLISKYLSICI